MDWLKEAIKNYDKLSESEQAHVDAACDALDEEEGCICGETDCGQEYEHMTGGY
jgi:ribosome assembly protein YihI (activator of Der GTPase)